MCVILFVYKFSNYNLQLYYNYRSQSSASLKFRHRVGACSVLQTHMLNRKYQHQLQIIPQKAVTHENTLVHTHSKVHTLQPRYGAKRYRREVKCKHRKSKLWLFSVCYFIITVHSEQTHTHAHTQHVNKLADLHFSQPLWVWRHQHLSLEFALWRSFSQGVSI